MIGLMSGKTNGKSCKCLGKIKHNVKAQICVTFGASGCYTEKNSQVRGSIREKRCNHPYQFNKK